MLDFKLLEDLCSAPSPSGDEEAARRVVLDAVKPFADKVSVDDLGSVIAYVKGSEGGEPTALECGMDECGVMLICVDDGDVKLAPLGEISAQSLVNREITFKSGSVGVLRAKGEKEKPEFSDLFVDFGVAFRENSSGFSPGDTGSPRGTFEKSEWAVSASSLSARLGAFLLLSVMKNMKRPKSDKYFAFTAQRQLDCRGARAALAAVKPSRIVSVACCGDAEYGKGAAILLKEKGVIAHAALRAELEDAAKAANAAARPYVSDKGNGGKQISSASPQSAYGAVYVPVKYMCLPREMALIGDISAAFSALLRFCEGGGGFERANP